MLHLIPTQRTSIIFLKPFIYANCMKIMMALCGVFWHINNFQTYGAFSNIIMWATSRACSVSDVVARMATCTVKHFEGVV